MINSLKKLNDLASNGAILYHTKTATGKTVIMRTSGNEFTTLHEISAGLSKKIFEQRLVFNANMMQIINSKLAELAK